MSAVEDKISKFFKTWQGRKFLEKENLNSKGIWEVRGEDTNPDLGGQHNTPLIGYVQGTAEQALRWGIESPAWMCWGHGGSIKKIKVISLEEPKTYPAPVDDYCDEEYC